MEWALSPAGLVYNAPALLVLGLLLFRMPLAAVVCALVALWRVTGYVDDYSGHAFIAGVALMDSRWAKWLGAGLLLFTATYYLPLWNEPAMFARGVLYGVVLGALDRAVVWIAGVAYSSVSSYINPPSSLQRSGEVPERGW